MSSTLYCALLLAVCRWANLMFPFDFLFLAGMTTCVALGQAIVTRASPRLVSLAIGAIYATAWWLLFLAFAGPRRPPMAPYAMATFVIGGLGAAAGYCAGGVAASLFLIADWGRSVHQERRAAAEETTSESPFDEPISDGAAPRD